MLKFIAVAISISSDKTNVKPLAAATSRARKHRPPGAEFIQRVGAWITQKDFILHLSHRSGRGARPENSLSPCKRTLHDVETIGHCFYMMFFKKTKIYFKGNKTI